MLINSIQACIQNAFKDYIDQEKGYPNCSTPWNEDMLKLENDTNQDPKSCDRKEKETQFYYDTTFLKQVAENKIKKCQGILCNYYIFYNLTNNYTFRTTT